MTVSQLLVRMNATANISQGRRFVAEGAVKLNGFVVTDSTVDHEFHVGDIITVGKMNFEILEEHLLETLV